MKKGSPSLNPYAASYVPLFKRGAADLNQGFNSVQELNALPQGQHQHTSHSYAHSGGVIQTAEFPKFQDHRVGEPFASTSQYPNESPEKSNLDEYFDMDLAYLQMTFPGISEESLSDVYLANRCDLDSAIDMLHQLEIYPDDSSDKLPETLDIGDVPESGSSSEVAPQKVKNVTAVAGASSSASSNTTSSTSK